MWEAIEELKMEVTLLVTRALNLPSCLNTMDDAICIAYREIVTG